MYYNVIQQFSKPASKLHRQLCIDAEKNTHASIYETSFNTLETETAAMKG